MDGLQPFSSASSAQAGGLEPHPGSLRIRFAIQDWGGNSCLLLLYQGLVECDVRNLLIRTWRFHVDRIGTPREGKKEEEEEEEQERMELETSRSMVAWLLRLMLLLASWDSQRPESRCQGELRDGQLTVEVLPETTVLAEKIRRRDPGGRITRLSRKVVQYEILCGFGGRDWTQKCTLEQVQRLREEILDSFPRHRFPLPSLRTAEEESGQPVPIPDRQELLQKFWTALTGHIPASSSVSSASSSAPGRGIRRRDLDAEGSRVYHTIMAHPSASLVMKNFFAFGSRQSRTFTHVLLSKTIESTADRYTLTRSLPVEVICVLLEYLLDAFPKDGAAANLSPVLCEWLTLRSDSLLSASSPADRRRQRQEQATNHPRQRKKDEAQAQLPAPDSLDAELLEELLTPRPSTAAGRRMDAVAGVHGTGSLCLHSQKLGFQYPTSLIQYPEHILPTLLQCIGQCPAAVGAQALYFLTGLLSMQRSNRRFFTVPSRNWMDGFIRKLLPPLRIPETELRGFLQLVQGSHAMAMSTPQQQQLTLETEEKAAKAAEDPSRPSSSVPPAAASDTGAVGVARAEEDWVRYAVNNLAQLAIWQFQHTEARPGDPASFGEQLRRLIEMLAVQTEEGFRRLPPSSPSFDVPSTPPLLSASMSLQQDITGFIRSPSMASIPPSIPPSTPPPNLFLDRQGNAWTRSLHPLCLLHRFLVAFLDKLLSGDDKILLLRNLRDYSDSPLWSNLRQTFEVFRQLLTHRTTAPGPFLSRKSPERSISETSLSGQRSEAQKKKKTGKSKKTEKKKKMKKMKNNKKKKRKSESKKGKKYIQKQKKRKKKKKKKKKKEDEDEEERKRRRSDQSQKSKSRKEEKDDRRREKKATAAARREKRSSMHSSVSQKRKSRKSRRKSRRNKSDHLSSSPSSSSSRNPSLRGSVSTPGGLKSLGLTRSTSMHTTCISEEDSEDLHPDTFSSSSFSSDSEEEDSDTDASSIDSSSDEHSSDSDDAWDEDEEEEEESTPLFLNPLSTLPTMDDRVQDEARPRSQSLIEPKSSRSPHPRIPQGTFSSGRDGVHLSTPSSPVLSPSFPSSSSIRGWRDHRHPSILSGPEFRTELPDLGEFLGARESAHELSVLDHAPYCKTAFVLPSIVESMLRVLRHLLLREQDLQTLLEQNSEDEEECRLLQEHQTWLRTEVEWLEKRHQQLESLHESCQRVRRERLLKLQRQWEELKREQEEFLLLQGQKAQGDDSSDPQEKSGVAERRPRGRSGGVVLPSPAADGPDHGNQGRQGRRADSTSLYPHFRNFLDYATAKERELILGSLDLGALYRTEVSRFQRPDAGLLPPSFENVRYIPPTAQEEEEKATAAQMPLFRRNECMDG